MGISTKTELSTKEKIAVLREKHQFIFDTLDIPNALFYPKMAYRPHGKDELYVSFFANELKREGDIYTEFVSRDYMSEDSNRTLWMWRYNPHWEEEYETTEPTDGKPKYGSILNLPKEKIPADPFKAFGDDLIDDVSLSDMTIRDFAAIMLGRPLSHKTWLNKLITDK